jgi:hypothetical protein
MVSRPFRIPAAIGLEALPWQTCSPAIGRNSNEWTSHVALREVPVKGVFQEDGAIESNSMP